ncbi:MAG: AMP-binding protein [Pseudomonadota bacterium]
MTLSLDQIWRKACNLGKQDFLVTKNERYTYADITSAIRMLSGYFNKSGLEPGDRLLICTTHEFAVSASFLAALLHGLVPINLAPDVKPGRANAIAASVACKLMIADTAIIQEWDVPCHVLATAKPKKSGLLRKRLQRIWPFETETSQGDEPRLPADPSKLAYLLFTSGSTAAPSGVMLTRGNLLSNLESVGNVLQLNPGDRQFVDLPMAHTDGLIHGPVLAFACQATTIRAGSFNLQDMEAWLNTVRQERCTHFMAVPYLWTMICRYAAHDDYFDGSELKMLISSAGRITPQLWTSIEDRFGKPVVNEYGMTETVMAALHAGSFDGMGTHGTLGKPYDCEAKVKPLSADEPHTGELLLRGENICLGYWNDAARTKASFDDDGWFGTGDIVRARSDGSFDLVGRSKTMINSAGLTIAPDEIDEVLIAHPAIGSALTVGIPDEDFGEVAVSAVELEHEIKTEQITEFARKKLELRKVPKRIVILSQIPRGVSGKPETETAKALVLKELEQSERRAADISEQDVQRRILSVAAKTFAVDIGQLSMQSGPDDVAGWDSFSHINFIFAIEDEFSQRVPAKKLVGMRTLGDVQGLLEIPT